MTTNDEQIDLLMRRYARGASRPAATEHLDADEMNAFAEGALPPAARSRYVSHLADCDHCRQQIAQLSLGAGAVIQSEQSAPAKPESRSVWQMLAGMFALPVLRYAAFAAVLLIVAGVAYLALRPRSEGNLVAGSQPTEQHPASALKAPVESNGNTQANAAQGTASPTLAATPSAQNPKREDSRVAENIAPPVATKEAPLPSTSTESTTVASQAYKTSPSYAPPPPGESRATVQEEQKSAAGALYDQKKAETSNKVATADRERDVVTKDAGRADDRGRIVTMNQPVPAAPRKAADEKQKSGPSRNMDNLSNRAQNESRDEPPKTRTGGEKQSAEEEAPEPRSVGGHKFRRQGSGWIDQKFKSSMAMKSISRGSDEFKELDSGLQSIAQQLSGQVIVVWKGHAYLIK
jgi:hypothetical protein